MFIAELGHPRFAELRPQLAAHRDHGRLAVPGRGDEAGHRPDAHERGRHLLRHDRDLAGLDPDRARRPAGASGSGPSAGCTRTSRSRSSIPRPARTVAARASRRALHPRLQRDARLLERPRAHRRGDRRRRLDAHRRPGHDGRRGLRQHRRADQGHGHPRRREHLPARDRGVPLHPPRHRRRPGDRRARRALRRGADGLGHPARRAPARTPMRCASSAAGGSPTTRSRATSSSSTSSR